MYFMRYTVIHENRHKVSNALAQEDVTYENYLRLAESILTGKTKVVDLQDDEEGKKRMKEIDELREKGEKTEYESLTNKNMKKHLGNPEVYKKRVIIETTNIETGEMIYYKSVRQLCDALGVCKKTINDRFKKAENEKIEYKGLVIHKKERQALENEIEPHRIYLNPNVNKANYKNVWNDEEKAFIVQNRPQMTWKNIGIYLGRSTEACSNMFRMMKKEDKLDYYRSLDISDKFNL